MGMRQALNSDGGDESFVHKLHLHKHIITYSLCICAVFSVLGGAACAGMGGVWAWFDWTLGISVAQAGLAWLCLAARCPTTVPTHVLLPKVRLHVM